MEVRASNFPEKLEEIQSRLAQARFVAVDLELTGVNADSENYADLACERLEAGCRTVECYAPIQLGITICSNSRELASYNIMTAPESTLLCDLSALKFLRQHNVDLNLWVDEGVRYVSREEAETPGAMFQDFLEPLVHEQHEQAAGTSSLCQAAQLRAKRREGVDLNAWVEAQESGFWRHQDTRRFSVSASRDNDALPQDLEQRKAGLPRLWQSIKDAKKPLIIHSGFKDVLFLLAAFEKRVLPRDPGKLADLLQECFPGGIQDTAYLHEKVPDLRLQPLKLQEYLKHVRTFHCRQNSDLQMTLEETTRRRYGPTPDDDDQDLAHEAGFDSFLTAMLFSYLQERPGINWNHSRNHFYLHKSTDAIVLRADREALSTTAYDEDKLVVAELRTQDARENTKNRISQARHNLKEKSFFYRQMDESCLLIPGCDEAKLVKLSPYLPGVEWKDFYSWQKEVRVRPPDREKRFTGYIKSFNEQRNFGFISSPECIRLYGNRGNGNDVFLHGQQAVDFKEGQHVSFLVEVNGRGQPQARELMLVNFTGIIRSCDPDNPRTVWIWSPGAFRVYSSNICWQGATHVQVGDQVDFSITITRGQPFAIPNLRLPLPQPEGGLFEFASV